MSGNKKVHELEQTPALSVAEWRNKLDGAERRLKPWREQAKKAIQVYEATSDSGAEKAQAFNIFFSNTETLRTATYSATPKPRVVPRFKTGKPLPELVSTILERTLDFEVDEGGLYDVFRDVVQSGLLTGFGLPRVTYTPQMGSRPVMDASGKPLIGQDGQPVAEQFVAFQKLEVECVGYDRVLFDVTRSNKQRKWIAFIHDYTRKDMEKLGVDPASCTFAAYKVSGEGKGSDSVQKCKVYEVWDKDTRTVFYLADGFDQAIKPTADPYQLEKFFPCPEPLQFLKRNGSIIPWAEYQTYRLLAESLEKISKRIDRITGFVKVAGAYDASSEKLAGLLDADDGTMLGANLMALGERGGMAKVFELIPVDMIVQVLVQLVTMREQIKQTIYEVTGISDIMRGSSVASESATAQRIKGNFGTLRIQERQKEVARVTRDTIAIMGELIANHYQPNILAMITGEELPEQPMQPQPAIPGMPAPAPVDPKPSWSEVMAVLRDDSVRQVIVDIETDSTISADEEAEQKSAIELVTAVQQYLTGIAPLVQSGAMPVEVAKELLMVALRRFKGVRAFSDTLDKWTAAIPAAAPIQQMGMPMNGQ